MHCASVGPAAPGLSVRAEPPLAVLTGSLGVNADVVGSVSAGGAVGAAASKGWAGAVIDEAVEVADVACLPVAHDAEPKAAHPVAEE